MRLASWDMLLAVSAIGPDRPGVLAAITGVLAAHGAEVGDARASLLCGHIGIMLVVEAPGDLDVGVVRRDLAQVASDLGVEAVHLDGLGASSPDAHDATLVLTVTGVEHPGIVHAVTHQLARHRINVCDMQARRLSDADDPENLYAMMLEISPPPGMDAQAVEDLIRPVAGERDLDVSISRLEE